MHIKLYTFSFKVFEKRLLRKDTMENSLQWQIQEWWVNGCWRRLLFFLNDFIQDDKGATSSANIKGEKL